MSVLNIRLKKGEKLFVDGKGCIINISEHGIYLSIQGSDLKAEREGRVNKNKEEK